MHHPIGISSGGAGIKVIKEHKMKRHLNKENQKNIKIKKLL